MPQPVYLDYNATAPVRPGVAEAMAEALSLTGNASSVHGFGREVRRRLERAREQVAALVAIGPSRVIFTSGGTEANNLSLCGAGRPRVMISAGEHDSVLKAAGHAERIPLLPDGLVDLATLGKMLQHDGRPALVSVMLANNETGVIQPIEEVVALAHRAGALVHCDAVQAAGKLPVDFTALGVDLMSLSAHKLGGPQGIGALLLADGIDLEPLLVGGGQEWSRRAGTENLPGIVGFGYAAELAAAALAQAATLADLRDTLEQRLAALAPDSMVLGAAAPRLANTSCFAVAGLSSETQVMALDLAGVAVSAGSACSSGKVRPSHVLNDMGLGEDLAGCAIRVSLGWHSEPEDIERFLTAWAALYNRRRAAARVA